MRMAGCGWQDADDRMRMAGCGWPDAEDRMREFHEEGAYCKHIGPAGAWSLEGAMADLAVSP